MNNLDLYVGWHIYWGSVREIKMIDIEEEDRSIRAMYEQNSIKFCVSGQDGLRNTYTTKETITTEMNVRPA